MRHLERRRGNHARARLPSRCCCFGAATMRWRVATRRTPALHAALQLESHDALRRLRTSSADVNKALSGARAPLLPCSARLRAPRRMRDVAHGHRLRASLTSGPGDAYGCICGGRTRHRRSYSPRASAHGPAIRPSTVVQPTGQRPRASDSSVQPTGRARASDSSVQPTGRARVQPTAGVTHG